MLFFHYFNWQQKLGIYVYIGRKKKKETSSIKCSLWLYLHKGQLTVLESTIETLIIDGSENMLIWWC